MIFLRSFKVIHYFVFLYFCFFSLYVPSAFTMIYKVAAKFWKEGTEISVLVAQLGTNWRVFLSAEEWGESERKQHRSVMSNFLRSNGLWPARLLCPWDFPGKNARVGCQWGRNLILPDILCGNYITSPNSGTKNNINVV